MLTAKEQFEDGQRWSDITARRALPLLLRLAKSGQRSTYGDLNKAIAAHYNVPPLPMVMRYGSVLEKIGSVLNRLSEEWRQEIPPLNILIYNTDTGLPGEGVNDFLKRYIIQDTGEQVTGYNRAAMIDRATDAVYDYAGWDAVADYFGVTIPGSVAESEQILLPEPQPIMGGESPAHRMLKEYVANHPELFRRYGQFDQGTVEAKLRSGDEVDVLFHNDDQILAVEVKTADAAPGEITRGLYQCVKYRAVLRAMCDVDGDLKNVRAVLITPQAVLDSHSAAADRLGVNVRQVSAPGQSVKR